MGITSPRHVTECALLVAVATSVWWRPPWWAYVSPVGVLAAPHVGNRAVAVAAAAAAVGCVAVAIWAVASRHGGESAMVIFALLAVAASPPHADCIWTAVASRG